MSHVICTQLRLGHLSVHVGDSSRRSEEIVKKSQTAPLNTIIIIIIIIIIKFLCISVLSLPSTSSQCPCYHKHHHYHNPLVISTLINITTSLTALPSISLPPWQHYHQYHYLLDSITINITISLISLPSSLSQPFCDHHHHHYHNLPDITATIIIIISRYHYHHHYHNLPVPNNILIITTNRWGLGHSLAIITSLTIIIYNKSNLYSAIQH